MTEQTKENQAEQRLRIEKEKAYLNACIKNIFSTEEGKHVMKYLEDSFLTAPVFSPQVSGDKQATHAAFREGENSLIRQLKGCIAKASVIV